MNEDSPGVTLPPLHLLSSRYEVDIGIDCLATLIMRSLSNMGYNEEKN